MCTTMEVLCSHQALYKRVTEYLELEQRITVLNNRFEVLTELLNIVREHENNLHIARSVFASSHSNDFRQLLCATLACSVRAFVTQYTLVAEHIQHGSCSGLLS